jgi:low temperature requirement protein LtrA
MFNMGYEGHYHEGKHLDIFASPLSTQCAKETHIDPQRLSTHSSNVELFMPTNTAAPTNQDTSHGAHNTSYSTTHVPFSNFDCSLHDSTAFQRHAEATTSELFYDLFFVANLTSFTSMIEINDVKKLKAYVGFFSLLWLTWYQVSLYDVRFARDSVFERVAKAVHFGVMVGFAIIGPQWHPGEQIRDYTIYKAFGLFLMVSRLTLFTQYSVTLYFSKKYRKTVLPLGIIMSFTLLAGILYGSLTPAWPQDAKDEGGNVSLGKTTNVYIQWYVIALTETLTTIAVSCTFRVISFKGTHMVQRMSLLTLIILGEGIIVICKSISKIVKNEFMWTAAVVGQVVSAVLIIYFVYMLYFDRIEEEHFGTIKQQIWSLAHFPLHVVLVLLLQGISLLIIWAQLVQVLLGMYTDFSRVLSSARVSVSGKDFADRMGVIADGWVFKRIPNRHDAAEEINAATSALAYLADAYDWIAENPGNTTARAQFRTAINSLATATTKALFDSFDVNVPKGLMYNTAEAKAEIRFTEMFYKYLGVFQLVFIYVFVAVSGLIL